MHIVADPPEPATDVEMIRATRSALDLLAIRLSVDVLYVLASGTRRYGELYAEVGDVSKKTLTNTLRRLERDGFVARRAHAEVPPRVEYSLTGLGWNLTGMLMSVYEWSAAHMPEVEEARSRAVGGEQAMAA
jgi:DNA-binding HxlR family transcriptional regulator